MNKILQYAKKHLDISNIYPILLEFEKRNIKLSEKTLESVVLGARHANELNYKKLYEENFLNGLICSNSVVTNFLESFDIDINQLRASLNKGIDILEPNFRNNYNISRIERTKKHRKQPYKQIGDSLDYFSKIKGKKGILGRLQEQSEEIKTDNLLSIILNEPVVWKAIKESGVSINKLHKYLESTKLAEPQYDIQKFIMWDDGKKIKIDVFNLADLICINETQKNENSPYKFNFISTEKFYLHQEIEKLEWLANNENTSEYDIQKFLEKNPWFLLGIEYKQLHSQVILTRSDSKNLKPDFMLEKINGNFVDIIELKKPQEKLVVGPQNRRTFSRSFISALGQLREYRNYFEDINNRKLFFKKYGLNAYKPKISVIIGRSHDFQNQMERINFMQEFSHLNLITFDDLIEKAKRRLEIL